MSQNEQSLPGDMKSTYKYQVLVNMDQENNFQPTSKDRKTGQKHKTKCTGYLKNNDITSERLYRHSFLILLEIASW